MKFVKFHIVCKNNHFFRTKSEFFWSFELNNLLNWIIFWIESQPTLYFELNNLLNWIFMKQFLNWILNWINFGQNSNIESIWVSDRTNKGRVRKIFLIYFSAILHRNTFSQISGQIFLYNNAQKYFQTNMRQNISLQYCSEIL